MKKLFRKMAALLAGALTAAVLTGCSMFPSQTEQPTATDTVLLMTQGDGMPALNKDEDVEEFLSCVNTTLGGSASLVITDGNRKCSCTNPTRGPGRASLFPRRGKLHPGCPGRRIWRAYRFVCRRIAYQRSDPERLQDGL